jgi:hypothetical protein
MAFTKEDQVIINGIWGDDEPDMSERDLKALVLGIKIMAEKMAIAHEDGLTVAFEAPTSLH